MLDALPYKVEARKPILDADLVKVRQYKLKRSIDTQKAVETRLKRKALKEALDEVLGLEMDIDRMPEAVKDLVQNYETLTAVDAIAATMVIKAAVYGDVPAAVYVRDTVGENPKQVLDLQGDKGLDISITVLNEGDGHAAKE